VIVDASILDTPNAAASRYTAAAAMIRTMMEIGVEELLEITKGLVMPAS
jgi:hypothetical protein